MNLENNRKSSDAHKPRINLTHKIDLQAGDKHEALSDLSIYYTQNNTKKL